MLCLHWSLSRNITTCSHLQWPKKNAHSNVNITSSHYSYPKRTYDKYGRANSRWKIRYTTVVRIADQKLCARRYTHHAVITASLQHRQNTQARRYPLLVSPLYSQNRDKLNEICQSIRKSIVYGKPLSSHNPYPGLPYWSSSRLPPMEVDYLHASSSTLKTTVLGCCEPPCLASGTKTPDGDVPNIP